MLYNPPYSPTLGQYWYVSERDHIILASGQCLARPALIPAENLRQRNLATIERNFAVIEILKDTKIRTLPLPNDIRFQIVSAACDRAINMLLSAKGRMSINQFICFNKRSATVNSELPEVRAPMIAFCAAISERSPLLVLDQRIRDNPALVAEHPRGPWEGQFSIRNQPIRLNPFVSKHVFTCIGSEITVLQWVDCAVSCFNQQDGSFLIAFYKLVHGINHEYWHILQTFLSQGREDTPPNMSGVRASRNTHRADREGEAGEFGERALYGGVVNFPQDQYPNGNLGFEGESMGYPWINRSDGFNGRVCADSLTRLMHAGWQDPETADRTLLTEDLNIRRVRRGTVPQAARDPTTDGGLSLLASLAPGSNISPRSLQLYCYTPQVGRLRA
jgi:hypothetical protein